MSDRDLVKLLRRLEKDLITQKDGVFREQVADIAPHIFSVNATAVKEQVRKQLLLKYGGVRGSKTTLPQTLEEVVNREVPKFTARLYAAFDPERTRRYYKISERKGTPEKFTVTVILKPGIKTLGTRVSVFRAIRTIKQRAQRPFLNALNTGLRKIGREQKIQASAFLDLGHKRGLAFERAEQALDVLGEEIEAIKTNDKSKEFGRVVGNLRNLGVQLGLSTRWPKDSKEFIVSIFLESASLNRAKGAKTEREVIEKLQAELRRSLENYPDWALQSSSDSKVDQVTKEIAQALQSFATIPGVSVKLPKELLKKVDKKPNKVTGKNKRPKVTPIGISEPILDLNELDKIEDRNSSEYLLRLKTILDGAISDVVRRNMGPPGLTNRTGTFANSVRIADIRVTSKGFPSIAYTYDKNPYQIFETGAGRAPWASTERDPRNLIEGSIRDIAKEYLIGRFFTRRV